MSKRILTVGAANMTMTVHMQEMPEQGQTVISNGGLSFSPGGEGGANAIAFTQYGAESFFCTTVGNDAHGRRLTDFYGQSGVHTSLIAVNPHKPTCTACRMLESASEASRTVLFDGAAATVTPNQIDEAFKCAPQALFLTLELPADTLSYAILHADGLSCPVFLDAAPVTAKTDLSALPPVTVFSISDDDTYTLTGIRPAGSDSCLLACVELQKLINAQYYVIKLGRRGSYVYDGVYCHSVASFVVPCTDSAGAGAAFNAALVMTYLECGNMPESARYANAAGALAVQKNGFYKAFPSREEINRFLAQHAN